MVMEVLLKSVTQPLNFNLQVTVPQSASSMKGQKISVILITLVLVGFTLLQSRIWVPGWLIAFGMCVAQFLTYLIDQLFKLTSENPLYAVPTHLQQKFLIAHPASAFPLAVRPQGDEVAMKNSVSILKVEVQPTFIRQHYVTGQPAVSAELVN